MRDCSRMELVLSLEDHIRDAHKSIVGGTWLEDMF